MRSTMARCTCDRMRAGMGVLMRMYAHRRVHTCVRTHVLYCLSSCAAQVTSHCFGLHVWQRCFTLLEVVVVEQL